MAGCLHEEFEAHVEVTRVQNGDQGTDELIAFGCDIRVRCVECGEPFGFRGVPCGISVNGRPMRSADALELRAWLLSPAEIALLDGPAGLVAP